MKICFGYELVYSVPQQTPMILALHCQPQGSQQLMRPDIMRTDPAVPLFFYADAFGNTCTRLEAPAGLLRVTADGIMEDSGAPETASWRPPNTPCAIFLWIPCSTCWRVVTARRTC